MQNYRIVVGVDGSEGGARALNWAVTEAARRGGAVQAVLAWQWADDERAVATGVHPADEEARAQHLLDDAVAAARATHPEVPVVVAEAVRGPSAEVLTNAASNADLLVLGSHGHGRIFHAVLGSVAEACIRAATCPVVVVPAARPAPRARVVATVSAAG